MITLIAAVGKNLELGEKNKLLWSLPTDMKHFQDTTKNSVVVVGRKTLDSFGGRILPQRFHLMLSRKDYEGRECVRRIQVSPAISKDNILLKDQLFKRVEKIKRICNKKSYIEILSSKISGSKEYYYQSPTKKFDIGFDEVFVIGGAQIYRLFLPIADKIVLTEVDAQFPNADTFFPKFSKDEWKEISRVHHKKDEKHEYAFDIVEYKKIQN